MSPHYPLPGIHYQVYAAVLELCLRTVRTSLAGGRNKEDLLSQWYTSLPPQALAGPGSRKLHLGALKYLVQVGAARPFYLVFSFLLYFCESIQLWYAAVVG